MTTDNDSLAAKIVASKSKVVGSEGAIVAKDLTEVACNSVVEADRVVGVAAKIAAKAVQARVPLLKDYSLCLDLANLLSNDTFCHLLQDEQALLNDCNLLDMTNDLVLLFYNNLVEMGAIEVLYTMETIEVRQRREATPVIERLESSGSKVISWSDSNRPCEDRGSESSEKGELSKHGV